MQQYEGRYEDVSREECQTVEDQECRTVSSPHCQDVTQEECRDVPQLKMENQCTTTQEEKVRGLHRRR